MRGAHDPIPAHFSSDLQALIKSMVNNNPAKRPDMNEIIGLPFLQPLLIEAQMTIGRVNPVNYAWPRYGASLAANINKQ
jgi:hypothetical protein